MHSNGSGSVVATAPPNELGRTVVHYLEQIISSAPDVARAFDLVDVLAAVLGAVESDERRMGMLERQVERLERELARVSKVVALPSSEVVADARDERRAW